MTKLITVTTGEECWVRWSGVLIIYVLLFILLVRTSSVTDTNSSNTSRTYFSSANGFADTTRIEYTPPTTELVKKNSFF